jgi:dTDP-4-dehydrorhamnose reductase
MNKLLITGANGLLGQKLVEQLTQENEFEVYATGRGESRIHSSVKNYHWISLDVNQIHEVEEVFNHVKPDIVIHTAAMTNVDECELNPEGCKVANITSVQYIISSSEKIGAHLIHLSTDFIFDGLNGPYPEDYPASPVNFYGETKLEAERLVKASSISWAIVRTVLVYGLVKDMSRTNIILWVKDSLSQGKKIKVVNDQWRTATLAEDLSQGCILIAKKRAKGIFNISGKDLLSPYQMACMTADFFGLDKGLIEEVDSSIFTQPAKRPIKTGFIIDKAVKELDYRPKSFMEGIAILSKQLKLADS